MPALRERGTDIILIARHYLNQFAAEEGKSFDGFDPEAERLLLAYPWPGNVRQLSNVVRNVVVLSPGGVATAAMLPAVVREQAPPRMAAPAGPSSTAPAAIRPMAEVEREAIEAALVEAAGNVGRAAALLEIDASTIYRKKREWARPAP